MVRVVKWCFLKSYWKFVCFGLCLRSLFHSKYICQILFILHTSLVMTLILFEYIFFNTQFFYLVIIICYDHVLRAPMKFIFYVMLSMYVVGLYYLFVLMTILVVILELWKKSSFVVLIARFFHLLSSCIKLCCLVIS